VCAFAITETIGRSKLRHGRNLQTETKDRKSHHRQHIRILSIRSMWFRRSETENRGNEIFSDPLDIRVRSAFNPSSESRASRIDTRDRGAGIDVGARASARNARDNRATNRAENRARAIGTRARVSRRWEIGVIRGISRTLGTMQGCSERIMHVERRTHARCLRGQLFR